MDKRDYERLMEIFLKACRLDGVELDEYLAQACGADQELSDRVKQMVDDERRAGKDTTVAGERDTKVQSSALTAEHSWTDEQRIGDYELISELGRGAMGVVYKARQLSLGRTVALKRIISGQLAGEAETKRFKLEAEAAATLDHPGIVPIHEISEHQSLPYFSMGFVDGGSLGDRLKDGPLEPRMAARLAKELADSIAYAHSQGIIHRDLKPGNILIDQDGRTRITDFGLAKKLDGPSELTSTGQILGTPSYMPPEQASGDMEQVKEPVDVYALGAVLYQMLCGRPPFQASSPIDTLIQVIDDEPTPPIQLNRQIPKDLNTICLKCLEKKPGQRYASARDLHDDLGRFLDLKPIHARPQSLVTVASRWVKRRPALALALSLSLLFLITVVGLSIGMAVQQSEAANRLRAEQTKTNEALEDARIQQTRAEENELAATREADKAILQAEIAEAVNEFLNVDLLAAVKPSVEAGKGREVRMIEVLLEAESRIAQEAMEGGKFFDKPLVEAAIRATLGTTLRELGEYESARPHLVRALELHRTHAGESSREAIAGARELASLYRLTAEYEAAEILLTEALEISRAEYGDDELTITLCGGMGSLLLRQIRMEEAAPYIEEQIRGLDRHRGAADVHTLLARMSFAQILRSRGQLEDALAELEEIKALAIEIHGEEEFLVTHLYNDIGSIQRRLERYDECVENRLKALSGYRRVYGDQHPYTLTIVANLGVALTMAERPEEATPYLREAMEGRATELGIAHSDALWSKCYLALNLAILDQADESLDLVDAAIADARQHLPADDWNIGDCLAMKGRILRVLKQYEQGDQVLEEAYQHLADALGPYHGYTYNALMNAIRLFDEWIAEDSDPDVIARQVIWQDRLDEFNRHREELARQRALEGSE